MHLEKPRLAQALIDPALQGYAVLQKLFFAPTETSQKAGKAFTDRLMQRGADREPISGPAIAQAQMGAFREWEKSSGERFADLKRIHHPTLVVNGVHDDTVPVRNSYLAEREPAECCTPDLPGLWPRFVVSIPRVLYAPGRGFPWIRFRIRARIKPRRSEHPLNGGLLDSPPYCAFQCVVEPARDRRNRIIIELSE
jgi:hypothetical protein